MTLKVHLYDQLRSCDTDMRVYAIQIPIRKVQNPPEPRKHSPLYSSFPPCPSPRLLSRPEPSKHADASPVPRPSQPFLGHNQLLFHGVVDMFPFISDKACMINLGSIFVACSSAASTEEKPPSDLMYCLVSSDTISRPAKVDRSTHQSRHGILHPRCQALDDDCQLFVVHIVPDTRPEEVWRW